MKKFVYSLLVVLFAIVVASCAKAGAEPVAGMINPEDKIGDFLITTEEGEKVTYQWDLDSNCVKQEGAEIYSCNLTTETKVNVSMGVYAAFSSKDLDTLWSEQTYNLFINDQPVNLEAFGSIDVVHPKVGNMRHWNVVIVASKPGEIKVRSEGTVDGEPFKDTTTFTFSAP